MKALTEDELRVIIREQLEWCEVIHQLAPQAKIQEAISVGQVVVYVTLGDPPSAKAPPPHRYLHVVSTRQVDQNAYGLLLKQVTAEWNAMTNEGRLAAAEARVGNKWEKEKLRGKLAKKGLLGF